MAAKTLFFFPFKILQLEVVHASPRKDLAFSLEVDNFRIFISAYLNLSNPDDSVRSVSYSLLLTRKSLVLLMVFMGLCFLTTSRPLHAALKVHNLTRLRLPEITRFSGHSLVTATSREIILALGDSIANSCPKPLDFIKGTFLASGFFWPASGFLCSFEIQSEICLAFDVVQTFNQKESLIDLLIPWLRNLSSRLGSSSSTIGHHSVAEVVRDVVTVSLSLSEVSYVFLCNPLIMLIWPSSYIQDMPAWSSAPVGRYWAYGSWICRSCCQRVARKV